MNVLKKIKSITQPKYAIFGDTYVMKLTTYQKYFKDFPFHLFSTFLYYDMEFVLIKQQCPIKYNSYDPFTLFISNGEVTSFNLKKDDNNHLYLGSEQSKRKENIIKSTFISKDKTEKFDICGLCRNKLSCNFFSDSDIKKSKKEFTSLNINDSLENSLLNLNFIEDIRLKDLYIHCYNEL